MVKFLVPIIFILISGLLSSSLVDCSDLKSLFMVFRHGERTLIRHSTPSICKTDKYLKEPKKYWLDGLEQLTNIGKRNLNNVGQFMRRKYDKFLGNNTRDIYVQSLDHDRCVESATLFINGLYKSQNLMAGNRNLPIPVPVHIIPLLEDSMLYEFSPCPNANEEKIRLENSEMAESFFNKFKHLAQTLAEKCERPVTKLTDICFIYDFIRTEISSELPLADWITEDLVEELENAHSYCFLTTAYSRKIQRLRTGIFFQHLLIEMEKIIKTEHLAPVSNDDDYRPKKGYFYSSVDFFMAYLFRALKLQGINLYPPFGATLIFELYKHSNSSINWEENSSIKLLYFYEKNSDNVLEIKIPDCSNVEICTIKKFKKALEDLLMDQNQWEVECGLREQKILLEESKEENYEMETDYIIVIIILIAVVINLILIIFINYKKKSHSKLKIIDIM